MSWLGAILGGTIGAFVAGPAGAVIGATVGHLATHSGENEIGNGGTTPDEERQARFVTALFACLAKVAKADGRVSEAEAAYIKSFINRNFAPEQRQVIRGIFNEARDNNVPFAVYVDELERLEQDPGFKQYFLGMLCELAAADGTVSARELEMLRYAEARFRLNGYVDLFFGGGRRTGGGPAVSEEDLAACYRVLGCSPDVSDRELKTAYRKKCAEFHPDKAQARGLPPELIEAAQHEMQRINQAYETIEKARKIR